MSKRAAIASPQSRTPILARLCLIGCLLGASPASAGSLSFVANAPNAYDHARLTTLPDGFGAAEFTVELWIRPDDSLPVGPTTENTPEQLVNWSDSDEAPYSSSSWWYRGNFLIDGHNNNAFERGTFSLQIYAGGRVRWLFGDGTNAGSGGHFAIQAYPGNTTPTLLDGDWHLVTLVRRFSGVSEADLELWIDGALVDAETSPTRIDMRTFWSTWDEFPVDGQGWFLGSEKQAATGSLSQYEDYKGLVAGLRFWGIARSPAAIASSPTLALSGTEPDLLGWYRFDEGSGSMACDALAPTTCMTLYDAPAPWSTADPPLMVPVPIAGWAAIALALVLGQTGCRAVRDDRP